MDGSSLQVAPVVSLDRGGIPYEVTLELRRDGESFGSVGQRCGYLLAGLADRVEVARADGSPQAADWPDPDDRFPDLGFVRGHNASCTNPSWEAPHEPELFAFRYRDRADLASTGELRCALRTSSVWLGGQEGHAGASRGRWRVARRAVVEAWGAGGRGVRAVLTSAELAGFLADLLAEIERLTGPSPQPSSRDLADRAQPGRSGR